uniref:Uncharacterized protein n=1 Tax=Pan troglodytes TaxID=9598 RepID=A0A2I3T5F3_PANTR
MMAASGRGIREKGGREGAGAGAPLESAGSEGDRAAGARCWRAGGAPRCRGWREKTAARGSAARRKGRGSRGWRKARGREPGWRACASPGSGEGGARGWELPGGGGAGASSGASSRRESGRESSR